MRSDVIAKCGARLATQQKLTKKRERNWTTILYIYIYGVATFVVSENQREEAGMKFQLHHTAAA
jgi:hypothetical protein